MFGSLGAVFQRQVPVIIPAFNNPTYLTSMIWQLRRFDLQNIIVVDNASTYPPMLDLLTELDGDVNVVRLQENLGPRAVISPANVRLLPRHFCLTDPDLELNPNLPGDFISRLAYVAEKHKVPKAGLALSLADRDDMHQHYFMLRNKPQKIWEWESNFWKDKIDQLDGNDVYRAVIDTTFALYDRQFLKEYPPFQGIRVADNYTARHLPWYRKTIVPLEEAEFYRNTCRPTAYTPKQIIRPRS